MRYLASIQIIHGVEPIEGADRIELVHVLGWQCVANKGQFKKGDKCVYFEIDSFLPVRDKFEFLRASSYKKDNINGEGFRIKTMRFKGELSQGLVIPAEKLGLEDFKAGTDVTERLGVKEWVAEERITSGGDIIGCRPADIPKTDETRVQAAPELINEFAGLKYYISTKMDGSSHSVCLDYNNTFHITGHNFEYKNDGKGGFSALVKKRDIEAKLRRYKASHSGIETITVQGELCAPGIQKNRLKLKQPEWYIFTVMINGKRCDLDMLKEVAETLDNPTVPIEEIGEDFPSKYPTVEAVLKRAEGQYPNGGQKEGIVIRPVEPVYCKLISASLSMKAISNKYLLKHDD